MHAAALAVIVVYGLVLNTTIVPEDQIPFAPADATGEFRFDGMSGEILQDR